VSFYNEKRNCGNSMRFKKKINWNLRQIMSFTIEGNPKDDKED
jgi:hypothetical protein